MKQIPLPNEYFALVDDDDFEALMKNKWDITIRPNTCYACRKEYEGDNLPFFNPLKPRNLKMHRYIMGLIPGDRVQVDHVDGNGLNNCRSNLRLATQSENMWNRKKGKGQYTSQYKGVSINKSMKTRPWMARLKVNGKPIYLGYYASEEEAALAYNEGTIKYHGKFARLNAINP